MISMTRAPWHGLLAVCAAVLWILGGPAGAQSPASRFISVNGVKIHYLEQGSGSPVVLIHGWYSSAWLNWGAPGTMAALARNHRVIALDLPGYGRSDKPDAPGAYGEQWIDDIGRLMDHLAVPKAHIIGYSMGGLVGLKFIVEHPDRVLSGALGGMGYMRQGSVQQQTWTWMPQESARAVSALALAPEQVREIRAPVEILIGSNDPIGAVYVAPLLAVRNDWRVVEIEGADHITCIGKQQFKDELAKWLAQRR